MRKILLLSCFILSSLSFSFFPATAMMDSQQEEQPPSTQAQRLTTIGLCESEIQDPWTEQEKNQNFIKALTFFREKNEEAALLLLEEGAKRRHPDFIKPLGQYYVRNNQPDVALRWLVLAHQIEFFTTFTNNLSLFSPLKGTSFEKQAHEYQDFFKNSSIFNGFIRVMRYRGLPPGMPMSKESLKNEVHGGLSMALLMSNLSNSLPDPLNNYFSEPWLNQTERVAKAYWVIKLLPKHEINGINASRIYQVLSSKHFGTTLSLEQREKLKWDSFKEFCSRYLPKLPIGKPFEVESNPPLSLLFGESVLSTIDITEYLTELGKCSKIISELKPSNEEAYKNAYLTKIENIIQNSSLEEQTYLSHLETIRKQGCPENICYYIEGLLYKYNKIGRSLFSYRRQKIACDLLKKAGFSLPFLKWVKKLEASANSPEYAVVMRSLMQSDPSIESPPGYVVAMYATEVVNLIKQVHSISYPTEVDKLINLLDNKNPQSFELGTGEEIKEELFKLLADAVCYFRENSNKISLKTVKLLGSLHLLAGLELDLKQHEKIEFLSSSCEILETLRAYGDRQARGLLAYNYLMLELLHRDGNEDTFKGGYYNKAKILLEELGITSAPLKFGNLLSNIKRSFLFEASEENILGYFFNVLVKDIYSYDKNREYFSEEIKQMIEGEWITTSSANAEPTEKLEQNNEDIATAGQKLQELREPEVSSETPKEAAVEALSDASETARTWAAEPLIRRARMPQKTIGLNSRQKLLETILSSKQAEAPVIHSDYKITFGNKKAKSQYEKYKADNNFKNMLKRVVRSIKSDPFGKNKDTTGKPELLKHNYAGHWSRRLNREHRIVYTVLPNGIVKIVEVGEHYQKSS